jgi:hypothetical protein
MTDRRVYSTMYHITPACVYFYTVSDLNIESGRQCTKLLNYTKSVLTWGHRGRDSMVVGFITTDASSSYLH